MTGNFYGDFTNRKKSDSGLIAMMRYEKLVVFACGGDRLCRFSDHFVVVARSAVELIDDVMCA